MSEEKINEYESGKFEEALISSDAWIVFRYKENEGINMHWKDKDSISLLPMALASQPELWDFVKRTVWDIKKGKI